MQAYQPNVSVLTVLDLVPELKGMASPALKLQLTTYEPGKAGPLHDHAGRPEAVYVLAGTITDHQGSVETRYRPGDTYVIDKAAVHWMENTGTVPARLLVAMVWDDKGVG
jgi:quercetin dioxygenase-like cupin family protein